MTIKRSIGFDLIKILAMFLIILYHLNLVDFGYVEGQMYLPSLTKIMWSLCASGVPMFFMVNGALTIPKKYSLGRVIEKTGRLLFVAIIWGGGIILCPPSN